MSDTKSFQTVQQKILNEIYNAELKARAILENKREKLRMKTITLLLECFKCAVKMKENSKEDTIITPSIKLQTNALLLEKYLEKMGDIFIIDKENINSKVMKMEHFKNVAVQGGFFAHIPLKTLSCVYSWPEKSSADQSIRSKIMISKSLLFVFKLKNGLIFGGYSPNRIQNCKINPEGSFLFRLEPCKSKQFKSRQQEKKASDEENPLDIENVIVFGVQDMIIMLSDIKSSQSQNGLANSEYFEEGDKKETGRELESGPGVELADSTGGHNKPWDIDTFEILVFES